MLTVWDPACPVAQKLQQMEVAAQPAREPLLAANARRPKHVDPIESSTVLVAGRKIEVWNDEFFSQVRRAHGISDNFLNKDKESTVDLATPRSESKLGKGGDAQYISRDAKFIIKSVGGADHQSLLIRTEAYVERLLKRKSLLVPIYLHFRDPDSGKMYLVMRNLTSPDVQWDEKYDLKGCADDKTVMKNGKMIEPVRKRFYRADMWCRCMWTPQRYVYYEGKMRARGLNLDFPMGQRDEIVRLVQEDAQWLTEQGLMDYSLFVAIRRVPRSQAATLFEHGPAADGNGCGNDAQAVRQWVMLDGESAVLTTLSIIDFLQPWTASKKIAKCIKSFEFNKATIPPPAYGARFKKHFAERFRGVDRLKPLGPADVAASNHGATNA